MTLHKGAVIALVWCLAATPAGAQGSTGTILGVVTDASGAAVPGALVTATNIDTQFTRSVPTDNSGQPLPHGCLDAGRGDPVVIKNARYLPPLSPGIRRRSSRNRAGDISSQPARPGPNRAC